MVSAGGPLGVEEWLFGQFAQGQNVWGTVANTGPLVPAVFWAAAQQQQLQRAMRLGCAGRDVPL